MARRAANSSSSTTRRAARTPTARATTTFAGDGGPKLDNLFKKLIYAIKFQSEQIFLSDGVTDESQILYDRNPKDRVAKVAPYLTLDSDVYPAIVDGRIVWIVDGYTTGTNYPYSQIEQPVDRDRGHLHADAGLRRSTTSTTSATR